MDNIDLTYGSSAVALGELLVMEPGARRWFIALRDDHLRLQAALQAREAAQTLAHPGKTSPASDLAPSCVDSKLRAKQKRAARARKAVADRVRAAMVKAVWDYRRVLRRRGWLAYGTATWLHEQMKSNQTNGVKGYRYVPDIVRVRKYLKRLSSIR